MKAFHFGFLNYTNHNNAGIQSSEWPNFDLCAFNLQSKEKNFTSSVSFMVFH